MLTRLIQLFQDNPGWSAGIVGISMLMLLGTLALTPWMIARLPQDYFHNPHHQPLEALQDRPWMRYPLLFLKNLVGFFFLLVGFALLFLPGQGLLTLVLAMVLIDFPGKFALKSRLIRIPRLHKAINHFRKTHGKPLFE
jgi:hypothetical protein